MTESAQEEVEIVDSRDASRYEIRLDGQLAGFADYRLEGDVITFTHTETDPAFGGRGLGSKLVAFAVTDVRSRNLRIVPQCPFVAAWIKDHEEGS